MPKPTSPELTISVLRVFEALQVDPKDPQYVEEYCQSFVDSNIHSITNAINDIFKKLYKDVLSLRIIMTLTFIQCARSMQGFYKVNRVGPGR